MKLKLFFIFFIGSLFNACWVDAGDRLENSQYPISLEAVNELKKRIDHSRYAIIGVFDKKTMSTLIINHAYPGGGYYLVQFNISKNLNGTEDIVGEKIKVKVPVEYLMLSDNLFLNAFENEANALMDEGISFKTKYKNREISKEDFEDHNVEWGKRISKMRYILHFIGRMKRGVRFLLSNDSEYVLFLRSYDDNGYHFNPTDIYPLGYGSFVDSVHKLNSQISGNQSN